MMKFFDRTPEQQEVIRKAYQFEVDAIDVLQSGGSGSDRNPWFDEIHSWVDGRETWLAINDALEMAYAD